MRKHQISWFWDLSVHPEKDEEHNDDPITEAEVNELTKAEREFQKKKKKRKQNEKEAALRKRVKKRAQEMKWIIIEY